MRELLSIVVFVSCVLSMQAQCAKGNCMNGQGTYQYSSGAKYVGNFLNGKIHGQGILYFSNGDRYIGDWRNQQRSGRGRYISKNGDTYLGDFLYNNFHGQGEMRYANGDYYKGQWYEGMASGQGEMNYASEDRYKGAWKSGLPEGDGDYLFSNGDLYEGQMKAGLQEGNGRMTYADGSSYKGIWWNGMRHGKGALIKRDGQIVPGEWIKDRLIDSDWGYGTDTVKPTYTDEIKVWAVIVGVGSYDHMPSLRFTDDDAYQMYAFLKSPQGGAVPESQISILIDENATYRNILLSLRTIFSKADANDMVMFYFSGHGLEGSFLPVDYDGQDLEVQYRDVREILEQSQAKHKIVIADACHSGGYYAMRSANKEVDNTVKRFYEALNTSEGGVALLLSSKDREYSLEDGGLRSGVFSYFIIKGLKGAADNDRDGVIMIQELYEYARYNVRQYTANIQNPRLAGDSNIPIASVRYSSEP